MYWFTFFFEYQKKFADKFIRFAWLFVHRFSSWSKVMFWFTLRLLSRFGHVSFCCRLYIIFSSHFLVVFDILVISLVTFDFFLLAVFALPVESLSISTWRSPRRSRDADSAKTSSEESSRRGRWSALVCANARRPLRGFTEVYFATSVSKKGKLTIVLREPRNSCLSLCETY